MNGIDNKCLDNEIGIFLHDLLDNYGSYENLELNLEVISHVQSKLSEIKNKVEELMLEELEYDLTAGV